MKLTKLLLAFVFLSTLASCGRKPYKDFVNKYFDESFSAFINKGIYVRERGDRNSLVLFIDSDLSESKNEGPYVVTVNQHLRKILKTSSHLYDGYGQY
jgi:hypothetical protein